MASLPFVVTAALALVPQAEPQGGGAVAFAQACLDATSDAVVMNIAAHPDDEAARTMVMLRHKHGARTVTVYTTCGGGGQNAVGREIGERLAAIRIRETLAAARHSGTEVRWLGFRDFGYSKTREETIEFWGGEARLRAAMDAAVDAERPDVVITNHGLARGHGHHRASAWAIREACEERGIPLYQRVFAGPAPITCDVGEVDPVRGVSYARQAHDGWREHATQGPWSTFDPTKVKPDGWSAANKPAKALGAFAAALPSVFDDAAFTAELGARGIDRDGLLRAFDAFGTDRARATHVAEALRLLPIVRDLAAAMREQGHESAAARLARRAGALERVAWIGSGVSFDVNLATRRIARGGEAKLLASLHGVPNGGEIDVDGAAAASPFDAGVTEVAFRVPAALPPGDRAAALTQSARIAARARFAIEGTPVAIERSIELPLGPAVRVDWPREAMFVPAGAPWERVVSLEVESFAAEPVREAVRIRAPASVTVDAIPMVVELSPEASTKRVFVRLRGDGSAANRFVLRVAVGGAAPARLDVQPMPVHAWSDALRVALVRGPDDTVERFLQDLGVDYEALDETELAVADFARFTTIVLDIRAYHHRPDLADHRDRMLEFNRAGGRIVACYHKPSEWNEAKDKPLLAPLELIVGRQRVSQEDAPVEVLAPDHPLLSRPFAIAPADFDGWVQERGLNFPDTWDPDWVPLLRMHDAGEKPHDGSLLVLQNGDGEYVYCSLAIYRQLRVGHAGAARMFLNMLVPSP